MNKKMPDNSTRNLAATDCPRCGKRMSWDARCDSYLCRWNGCGGSRTPVFKTRHAWACAFKNDGKYYLFEDEAKAIAMLGDLEGDVCPVAIVSR